MNTTLQTPIPLVYVSIWDDMSWQQISKAIGVSHHNLIGMHNTWLQLITSIALIILEHASPMIYLTHPPPHCWWEMTKWPSLPAVTVSPHAVCDQRTAAAHWGWSSVCYVPRDYCCWPVLTSQHYPSHLWFHLAELPQWHPGRKTETKSL